MSLGATGLGKIQNRRALENIMRDVMTGMEKFSSEADSEKNLGNVMRLPLDPQKRARLALRNQQKRAHLIQNTSK